MIPIETKKLADLTHIGTVEVLDATIVDGTANAYLQTSIGSPEDGNHSAYFGVEKSIFRMKYPFTEHACVVTGEVILTDEDTGQKKHYKPGDSWLIEKGTHILWEIKTEEFVKHYLAQV